MVTRPTPHAVVYPIEKDRVDRSRCPGTEVQVVSHGFQLGPNPRRHRFVQSESTGPHAVITERAAHLITGDIRCLGSLLNVHPELHHIEEELQQIAGSR